MRHRKGEKKIEEGEKKQEEFKQEETKLPRDPLPNHKEDEE